MAQATLPVVEANSRVRVAMRVPLLTFTVFACAVVLLVALALPMLRGRVYLADDLGQFHLPARAFYAESLARGESFDWWPALFSGFYLTGEGQHGPYHPLHLILYRSLSLPLAFDLEVVLSYPWMLLGTYFWLRRLLPRADAALFGAFCFTFSGFTLLHLPHINAIAIVAQLPWLLWAIDVAVRDSRPRWRVFATAAVALLTGSQLLLGYPQYVWFSLLVEAGYVWWLLRSGPSAWLIAERGAPVLRRNARDRTRIALTLAGAVGVGFLLAGVQLLPTLDALATSTRRDAGVTFAEWGSLHPWNLLQLVAPYLFVNRVVGQNTHELGLYAGCVPLMLCAWLWIRRSELGALRPLVVAATVAACLSLWMAFGEYGVIYRVQTWLPVVGKFRFPCRMIVIFHLATAVLAAVGLALLAARHPARLPLSARRYAPLWFVCGASIVVASAAVVAWPDQVARWPAMIAGPLLLAAAAVLVWQADRNRRAALAALVVLAAFDLGVYGLSYSVWGRTDRFDSFVARTAAAPAGSAARILAESPVNSKRGERVGNAALLSGWHRIDGYAGLEPAQLLDYRQPNALRVADAGSANGGEPLGVIPRRSGPPKSQIADRSPASLQGLTPPARLDDVRMVSQVRESSNPAHDIAAIDPATTALVEPGFTNRQRLGTSVGHAAISAQAPGRIAVHTVGMAFNLLVVNQSWHSGWQARLDGQPVLVERVYGDFFGTVVPPGNHQVEFDFHPASLTSGRIVSAAGLVCLILGMAWVARSNEPDTRNKERSR